MQRHAPAWASIRSWGPAKGSTCPPAQLQPVCEPSTSGRSSYDLDAAASTLSLPAAAAAAAAAAEHARRLQEMAGAAAAAQAAAPPPGGPPQPPSRRLDIENIPSLVTGKKQPPKSPQQPAVEWREIVERARQAQERVSGRQMLTDTFGWVGPGRQLPPAPPPQQQRRPPFIWSAVHAGCPAWVRQAGRGGGKPWMPPPPPAGRPSTRPTCTLAPCPQPPPHLPAHQFDGALQPALHLLHALGGGGAHARQGPADRSGTATTGGWVGGWGREKRGAAGPQGSDLPGSLHSLVGGVLG